MRRNSYGVALDPTVARRFGRLLRRWFRANGRDLPWRRTRDPYRILVSELMLQQTQVSRVVTRYGEFLETFPTLHDVARARPKRVMEAWAGLGYYARARRGGDAPRRRRRATVAAGDRGIHRRRGELVRLRTARRAGGHERRAGDQARVRAGGRSQIGARPEGDLAHRPRAATAHRHDHLDAQSGTHGARRPRVHGPRRAMRRVSGKESLCEWEGVSW